MPKIPASERDAFYEARRAEIAAIALCLWAEKGFDQTSVAQITQDSGISKGTFYLYFDSKQALLVDVMRRNSLAPHVKELVAALQTQPLETAIEEFVRGAWRHLCDHRDLVLVALREIPTHLTEAQAVVERLLVPANELLARYLEERIPKERAEQLSLVISARGLLGMVIFVFVTQEILGFGRALPVSEDDIVSTVCELFLRGVTAAPKEEEP